jgi:hypothetical protein
MNGLIPKPLDGDDVVWQHMPIEYFYRLLECSEMYFKAIVAYDPDDVERFPSMGIDPYLRLQDPLLYLTIKDVFQKCNNYTYISCWFRNACLLDGVFKRFADSDGVAVKTRVSRLIKAFDAFSEKTEDFSLYYGSMQYVAEHVFDLQPLVCKQKAAGIELETIVPYFYKGTNLADEKEFRLLIRDQQSLLKREQVSTFLMVPIPILDTIEGIAIPITQLPKDAQDIQAKLKDMRYVIREDKPEMDGYVVYTLKKGGV